MNCKRTHAALRRRRGLAGAQPRTGRAQRMNRPILRLYGLVVAAVRAARRLHLALDGLRRLLPARKPAQPARPARAGTHPAWRDPRRRRHRARAQRAHRERDLRTHLPRGRGVRPRDRLLLHRSSAAAPSSATATPRSPVESQSNLQSLLNELQGRSNRGDRVVTTLDPSAQQAALAALGGHEGAVVALQPRTGAVTVMASTPSFDPNALANPTALAKLEIDGEDPAGQPRRAVRLRPGLHLQGRDRHRRHRHRPLRPLLHRQRTQRHRRLRGPPQQRQRRKLRPPHAHRGAREIGQHRVGAGRRTPRPADARPLHAPLRVRRQAPARLPRRRNVSERGVPP